MLQRIDTGLVYRNPQPHLRAVHAWHPSIVRLDDGEMLASFDLGQAAESLDYRTYLSRSTDDGRTWSPPKRWFEDPYERPSTHTVRMARTTDGTIVGFGARHHRDDPEEGLVNRDNLGFTAMDLILLTSADGGRNWAGPRTIDPPLVGPSFEICHPVLELPDGRWLAPTATWRGFNGEAPNGMKAIALVSHDQGATWPEFLDVMSDPEGKFFHWEQSITVLGDGRLLAVAWVVEEANGKTHPTVYSISEDGRTFSPPRPNGVHGQTAKVLALADGRILCVYRRHDQPGLWAELAKIDGDRWVRLAELRLWQGAASGMTGEGNTGDELSDLKFGFPNLLQLPDGDVFAVFWCNEDCIGNIRWLRIRAN